MRIPPGINPRYIFTIENRHKITIYISIKKYFDNKKKAMAACDVAIAYVDMVIGYCLYLSDTSARRSSELSA